MYTVLQLKVYCSMIYDTTTTPQLALDGDSNPHSLSLVSELKVQGYVRKVF